MKVFAKWNKSNTMVFKEHHRQSHNPPQKCDKKCLKMLAYSRKGVCKIMWDVNIAERIYKPPFENGHRYAVKTLLPFTDTYFCECRFLGPKALRLHTEALYNVISLIKGEMAKRTLQTKRDFVERNVFHEFKIMILFLIL